MVDIGYGHTWMEFSILHTLVANLILGIFFSEVFRNYMTEKEEEVKGKLKKKRRR